MEFSFMLKNSWLIPGIPFFSFILLGLFIRKSSPKLTGVIATLSIFISAFFACLVAWDYFHLFPPGTNPTPIIPWSFEWLNYQDVLAVDLGVFIDPISVLLMLVVTIVSSLVHLYSIEYMAGDRGYARYFTFLNLFTFSMLGVVVAPNILQLFICWELVGVSSFLLIGYHYERPSAVSASKKAFIVTRFADLFFWIGILMLGYFGYKIFGTTDLNALQNLKPFDFLYLNNPDVIAKLAEIETPFGANLLTLSMIFVFIGAAGKSAMFPLHIWLPDAMEGPTPVSALIHAATMVVAGVYLVARLFPGFAFSTDALLIVAYVGAFTSIFAAIIGCTQDDIKRVLAYSTLSQIGYMMFALGVATLAHPLGYTASMFHLFTHAFFKALLFLAAGAMIHAVHSNEIWDMGGLAKKMPITHITFLIATLAISGIPPFAGFFSKDEILAAALHNHHQYIYILGLIVGGLTAFYMFRIYIISFLGKPRTEKVEHAHDAPAVMTIPLVILAIFSIVAGFVPFSNFIHIGEPLEHHGIDLSVAIRASSAAIIGIVLAFILYTREAAVAKKLVKLFATPYMIIKRKFYIDEIYLFITKKIIFRFIAAPIAWFDRNVVDGGVNLSGWATRSSGVLLKNLQTGQVQTYGLFFINGAIFVLLFLWILLWA